MYALNLKEVLISYNDTKCFAQNRYILNNGKVKLTYGPSVWIMLEGEGKVTGKDYEKQLKKGDYFYLPFSAENNFEIEGKCTLIECLPSKQD